MAKNTKVAWAHHTLNFWWGCEKVSPGCANCYAERFARSKGARIWGTDQPRRRIASAVTNAINWNAEAKQRGVRYRVFCQSMADFFERDSGQIIVDHSGRKVWATPHEESPYEVQDDTTTDQRLYDAGCVPLTISLMRDEAWRIIQDCTELIWMITTKRIDLAASMWPSHYLQDRPPMPKKLDNVVLLTSVENQDQAELRIPHLCAMRRYCSGTGLSMEPLLEEVTIAHHLGNLEPDRDGQWRRESKFNSQPLIDFVAVGGESGYGARDMKLQWPRLILGECRLAGTSFFMKQLSQASCKTGHDAVDSFPADLRVQEFPTCLL